MIKIMNLAFMNNINFEIILTNNINIYTQSSISINQNLSKNIVINHNIKFFNYIKYLYLFISYFFTIKIIFLDFIPNDINNILFGIKSKNIKFEFICNKLKNLHENKKQTGIGSLISIDKIDKTSNIEYIDSNIKLTLYNLDNDKNIYFTKYINHKELIKYTTYNKYIDKTSEYDQRHLLDIYLELFKDELYNDQKIFFDKLSKLTFQEYNYFIKGMNSLCINKSKIFDVSIIWDISFLGQDCIDICIDNGNK